MTDVPNGSTPVTRYELSLALDPMRGDIRDMKADMRKVLDALAADKGASDTSKSFLDKRWKVITTIVGLLTSSIATLTFTLILKGGHS